MTFDEVMALLESKGDAKMKGIALSHGATNNPFGMKMGDIRGIAKEIKSDHRLGLELWAKGNLDAKYLATLILTPKLLSESELEEMLVGERYTGLVDWLITNVVKKHPKKAQLCEKWSGESDAILGRACWSLMTEKVLKEPQSVDPSAILDRIERTMLSLPAETQWTMNYCLAEIGITMPEFRDRAIGIGERLGLYRDYPVSKGCTSPFAPIWIRSQI